MTNIVILPGREWGTYPCASEVYANCVPPKGSMYSKQTAMIQ